MSEVRREQILDVVDRSSPLSVVSVQELCQSWGDFPIQSVAVEDLVSGNLVDYGSEKRS